MVTNDKLRDLLRKSSAEISSLREELKQYKRIYGDLPNMENSSLKKISSEMSGEDLGEAVGTGVSNPVEKSKKESYTDRVIENLGLASNPFFQ